MSNRLRATIGYVVLIGTGLALLLPHFFISHRTIPSMLIGGLLPALLAVSILSSAALLYNEDISSAEIVRISLWTLAVALVGVSIAGSMVVYQWSRGVELSGVAFVLLNSGVGGAICGLILGVYSADRYATKQELESNQNRIRALNERLTVLNRVLRHDIRNDINVIQGYADLIEQGRVDAETALQMIQQKSTEIADFSDRAREIERLMQTSTQEREPIDLVPILEREIEEVREGYMGVDLETTFPESAEVEASPLIESAIDNLVENAVEHNDKPTARVEVVLESNGDGYYLEVEDNGPGLPRYERRLLEGGQETKLEHSDGIGLWLVNWIVEESDGRVAVESDDDSGTTIALWLPGADSEETETGSIDYAAVVHTAGGGDATPGDDTGAASPSEASGQFG